MKGYTVNLHELVENEHGEPYEMPGYPQYVLEFDDYSEMVRVREALIAAAAGITEGLEVKRTLRDMVGHLLDITAAAPDSSYQCEEGHEI